MKPLALVTGGNRGIGRGIVLALAQRGFDIGRTVAALATGDFPFVTGEAIHVDGGLHIQRL